MVRVVVVVGWETSSILSIEVSWGVSALVQVDFGLVVGIQRFEKSEPGSFFLFIASFVTLELGICLLEHLLIDNGIVVGAFFHHSSLWLKIWSSIILILNVRVVSVFISNHTSANHHGQNRVSPEVFKGGSCWIDVWPVMNPSLDWDSSNTSLRNSSSSSNKHSKWPWEPSSNEEVEKPLSSIVVSERSIVFPWDSFRVRHKLSWSHCEPSITLDIILEPNTIKWIKKLTIACIRVQYLY